MPTRMVSAAAGRARAATSAAAATGLSIVDLREAGRSRYDRLRRLASPAPPVSSARRTAPRPARAAPRPARSASAPSTRTSIEVPRAAPSIISPMIESPETSMPSRLTSARASKRSTVSTNFAEARACSPFSLTISSENCIAVPAAACGQRGIGVSVRAEPVDAVDVFAPGGQGGCDRVVQGLVPRLGELDEQRQVGAVEHPSARGLATGADREVRRRRAEHVGDHHHPLALVDRGHRGVDLGLLRAAVVVGVDRDGRGPGMLADHVLQGQRDTRGQGRRARR